MANGEVVQRDASAVAEQTRNQEVYVPAVDIYETESELVVLADMPGVDKDELSIHLEENILTLEGPSRAPAGEGEDPLLTDYQSGTFRRQFSLGEAIDREKIQAKLKNGELRLVLPKSAAAQPTRIQVQAS